MEGNKKLEKVWKGIRDLNQKCKNEKIAQFELTLNSTNGVLDKMKRSINRNQSRLVVIERDY